MQITYDEFINRVGHILHDVHDVGPSLSCAIRVVESEVSSRAYERVVVSPEQFVSMYLEKEEKIIEANMKFYAQVFGGK